MKIIGIGNAIIDIVCKIDDGFLAASNLTKSSMSLIDEDKAQEFSLIKSEKITSGGSVGNTIAALAQLGVDCGFIGKVSDDDFGREYILEIEKTGAKFLTKKFDSEPSALSFIFVSMDAQRTMATFLGCASKIHEDDILESHIKGASVLYLEGYLWDSHSTISSLKKAINFAKIHNVKIAFSLSDLFCVTRHHHDFLELAMNDLDILFANEKEIEHLVETEFSLQNLNDFFAKNKKLTAVVTRSEKGCVVFQNGNFVEVSGEKVEKVIDTTGAGDAFAAGFLYGLVNNYDLKKSAHFANILASKIIQKFGARFENSEIEDGKKIN